MKIKDLVCYTILGEYEVFNNFAITFLNISYYNVILIYDHLNNVIFISINLTRKFFHIESHPNLNVTDDIYIFITCI